jgi:Mrp family chromosome partitioning ATPase
VSCSGSPTGWGDQLREKAPTDTLDVLAQRRGLGPTDVAEAVVVAAGTFLEPLPAHAREISLDFAHVDAHLTAVRDEEPRLCAPYEQVAAGVIAAAMRRPLRRVLIASAHHGEGRTTVTLNLAAALHRANHRVLVVDSDLSGPSMSRLLGIDPESCFAEAMARGLKPWAALTRLRPCGFDVLFSRGTATNPLAIITSHGFTEMLQSIGSYYDFVLLDSSPLLDGADSQLLARLCDTVLLVVRPGATTATEMARAVSHLVPDDILAVVLNQVRS